MQALILPNKARVAEMFNSRPGEEKVGEKIVIAEQGKRLEQYQCQYALVGIPEDIGPRANLGLGGSREGWKAFLSYFLNFQANEYLPCDDILLLGEISCDDIHPIDQSLPVLRDACSTLDARVCSVLIEVFKAGLIPIVIGGGTTMLFLLFKHALWQDSYL